MHKFLKQSNYVLKKKHNLLILDYEIMKLNNEIYYHHTRIINNIIIMITYYSVFIIISFIITY